MPKYLLAYVTGATSGQQMMAPTPEQQQQSLAAWTAWFTSVGVHMVDPGNPTGASTTIGATGRSDGSSAGLTGYSVIQAESLDEAAELAKGCPVISDGGEVHVYETFNAM